MLYVYISLYMYLINIIKCTTIGNVMVYYCMTLLCMTSSPTNYKLVYNGMALLGMSLALTKYNG